MAHLWIHIDRDDHKGWAIAPLDHTGEFILSKDNEAPVKVKEQGESPGLPQINRSEIDGRDAWVLLTPPDSDVSINGLRMLAGERVLKNMDEILLRGMGRIYFSTEKLATVEPFPGGGKMLCGRCRQEIKEKTPGVKCPGCGIWHHQSNDDLPCWTYSSRCSNCDYQTEIGSGYRWTPEGL